MSAKTPEQHLAQMGQQIGNYARRVEVGESELSAFVQLRRYLDDAERRAVAVMLAEPHSFSWAQVGDALGITRQAAWQRYHDLPHARQAGGQPAALR